MSTLDPVACLAQCRIVPVVTTIDAELADPLADALIAGGLPIAEITLRSPSALAGLARLGRRKDILVGAGTVLTIDQAKAAVDAGAAFLVAPGLDLKLVDWARDNGVLIVPGVATATELTHAYNAGLRKLKFFPAESSGGLAAIRMLAGPFPDVRFMPTGGITTAIMRSYLESEHVIAIGQNAMVRSEMITGRRFSEITTLTRARPASWLGRSRRELSACPIFPNHPASMSRARGVTPAAGLLQPESGARPPTTKPSISMPRRAPFTLAWQMRWGAVNRPAMAVLRASIFCTRPPVKTIRSQDAVGSIRAAAVA